MFFVHNDTESEFDVLEDYAIKFLHEICAKINESDNTCVNYITKPSGNFFKLNSFGDTLSTLIHHLKLVVDATYPKNIDLQ